jgi:hypothetical protein
MKKESIERLALRYTGLASAVLGTQALSAQVVWTDIPDTTLSTNNASYGINLDNDTVFGVDFRITQLVDSGLYNISGVILSANGLSTNQAQGLNVGNYNYPMRLNVGDSIGPNEIFRGINAAKNIGYMAFEVEGSTYPSSNFVDTANGFTDAFLGLRFTGRLNDTNRTFFGWVRLDVAADLKSVTIKDYGYQPDYNTGLSAGENSPIGLQEKVITNISFRQLGKQIVIELPEDYTPEGELLLSDLSGKPIKSIAIERRNQRVALDALPKGILIATLRSNGEAISKKVVVLGAR